MQQILAELEMISHGKTMKTDGRVAGSNDKSPLLRVDEEPYPHELFRRRYLRARTDTERARVEQEAAEELRLLRKGPERRVDRLTPFSFAWKRAIANDPRGASELARVFPVSRQTVYNYRALYREEDE